MGTNLKDLLIMKEIDFPDLKDKLLIVDSFNILYQFLSNIRQPDGTPLKDSRGRVTSHLTGLFTRTTNLMSRGIKLGFVFDGQPPALKHMEHERRAEIKKEAMHEYQKAKEAGNIEEMKKFASRTSRLTTEMIEESKELIRALGLPVIQAKSEGEAQMAYVVNHAKAFAGVSEDYDSLLYGINNLVKNLTISGKRKIGAAYINIKPKIINFSENINNLGIDREQLIALALLVGTDYNYGGIKGIGPKTAIKLVKKHGKDFDSLFKETEWDKHFDIPWTEIYDVINKMPVNTDFDLKFGKVNPDKIRQMLIEEHDFSKERVESSLSKVIKEEPNKDQKGLGEWFG
jgi:flap endonuclease-1